MSSIVIQGDTSGSITVEAPSVAGTHTLTLPKVTGNIATDATVGLGMKNLIINGDMRIDQRNAGSAVATTGLYPVDRTRLSFSGGGVITGQRSTTAPNNFTNSLYALASTADASVAAGDFYGLQQFIEGFNAAHLGFGTASAKTVTISFWVRASISGTYCVAITNAANNKSYVAEYSISAIDTWEYKTVTIAGETSGTWNTDSNAWGRVRFSLGGGTNSQTTAGSWSAGNYYTTSNQVNWIGTLNSTFYITGVQLEVGENATPFENRMYSTELALCQRYCEVLKLQSSGNETLLCNGYVYNVPTILADYALKVTKRAQPSLTTTGTVSSLQALHTGGWVGASSVTTQSNPDVCRLNIVMSSSTGFSNGYATEVRITSGLTLTFTAEL